MCQPLVNNNDIGSWCMGYGSEWLSFRCVRNLLILHTRTTVNRITKKKNVEDNGVSLNTTFTRLRPSFCSTLTKTPGSPTFSHNEGLHHSRPLGCCYLCHGSRYLPGARSQRCRQGWNLRPSTYQQQPDYQPNNCCKSNSSQENPSLQYPLTCFL